jgi:hypothetical protein
MKYYLVSQTSITNDIMPIYNYTEHFLLKLENEDNKYYPVDEYDNPNDYYNHEMTELTENQFNSLKDTFEIREFLNP